MKQKSHCLTIKSMFEISGIHSRGGFSLLSRSFAPLRNETNKRALVPFPWWFVCSPAKSYPKTTSKIEVDRIHGDQQTH